MTPSVLGGIDYSKLQSEVWCYSSRTLTKYVGVIERARGKGYEIADSVYYYPIKVMRERRAIKGGTKFMLIGDVQNFYLGDESNDLIPTATKTVLQTGFDDTNLKDHDDDTYSIPATDVPPNSVDPNLLELVKYDFRSVEYRYVYVKIGCDATYGSTRVLISEDDEDYYVLAMVEGGEHLLEDVYGATFRYIKLAVENMMYDMPEDASKYKYYTIEVYRPSTTSATTSVLYYGPGDVWRTIQCYVSMGYYQLLEVIEL